MERPRRNGGGTQAGRRNDPAAATLPRGVAVHRPDSTSRHELEARREHLVSIVNAVSRRTADAGVVSTFHPNSPHTSINRTEEDYRIILEGMDASVTGWTPDVGHIANGGMDPLAKMQEYASLINHVHYKDWDGNPEFVIMGAGKIDFTGITNWLVREGYAGWIICEDEGAEPWTTPMA